MRCESLLVFAFLSNTNYLLCASIFRRTLKRSRFNAAVQPHLAINRFAVETRTGKHPYFSGQWNAS